MYKPPNQRIRKIREEEIGNEEDNNYHMIMLESFNFEDVWSFNHPHLSMKECREKLHSVEVPIEKGAFQVFQEQECNNCDYARVKFATSLRVHEGKVRKEVYSLQFPKGSDSFRV